MTKELTEVKSSNVAAIGFDDGVLTVKYKNNRTYSYHNVPEELYTEILNSDSIGQVLAEKVKGEYPTKPTEKEETNDTASEDQPSDGSTGNDESAGTQAQSDAGADAESQASEAQNTPDDDSQPAANQTSSENDEAKDVEGAGAGESDREPNLGEGIDPDQSGTLIKEIMHYYGATAVEHDHERPEDGVIVFSVLRLDPETSDVPIEIANGTLSELHAPIDSEPKSQPLDQEPDEAQSKNLNILRDELSSFDIDLQYERVEDKIGDRYWNLKASVERDDSTLTYTTKIVENCTADEAEAAAKEIVANFVKAG